MPRRSAPALILLASALTACRVLEPIDAGVVAWEAELLPTTAAPVGASGSAAALSQNGRTRASIRFTAEPGTSYGWLFGRGSCEAPVAVLGTASAYPPLEAGSDGVATGDFLISVPMPSTDVFHASVLDDDTVIACGEFSVVS